MILLARLVRRQDGGAALEFAIIAPVLVLMLLGMLAYGGYFWTAHAVQQVANDAARTSVAGLNAEERAELAQQVLDAEIDDYAYLDAALAEATVTPGENGYRVAIAYDASDSIFWSLAPLVPMPSSTVTRTATVRLGGY